MDTTVIISIIISTIVALAIVALVVVLFYYHWRNQELLRKVQDPTIKYNKV